MSGGFLLLAMIVGVFGITGCMMLLDIIDRRYLAWVEIPAYIAVSALSLWLFGCGFAYTSIAHYRLERNYGDVRVVEYRMSADKDMKQQLAQPEEVQTLLNSGYVVVMMEDATTYHEGVGSIPYRTLYLARPLKTCSLNSISDRYHSIADEK